MRRFRAGLTYVNVVGTLALFLTLSGGVVLAANKITSKQIGRGAVKNRNLAKNAIKAKNLAKKSVTSAKLANGAVKNAAIADGAVNFAKLAAGADVVASSTTAIVPASLEGPIAFNPPLSATPAPGQVLTVHLESHGTLTSTKPGEPCVVIPIPVVNGNPMLIGLLLQLVGGIIIPPFTNGIPAGGVNFPIGMTQPGVPQNVSLFLAKEGPGSCTPGSSVQVSGVITQAK